MSFYPKNQNLEKKMKKMLGDITILHKCGINDNHIIRGYTDQNGSWYLIWVPNLNLSPKYD